MEATDFSTDFSTPRRMSKSAYVVILAKTLKRFNGLFFMLVTLFCLNQLGNEALPATLLKFMGCLGLLLLLSSFIAYMRYYFHRYYIEDGKLVVKHGWLARNVTDIPLDKVHTLRTTRGFLYRLFSIRGISFDTLASDKEEVELILDEADWKKLYARLQLQELPAAETAASVVPPPFAIGANGVNFNNANLLKGAMCQNHLKGFAVLAGLFGALIGHLSDLDDATDHRVFKYIDYLDAQSESIVFTVVDGLMVVVALYLVVMALWIGKVMLRYANMKMHISRDHLLFESGLISKFTSRMAYDKVSSMSIKQNPLEKWSGSSTIVLRQALNASDSSQGGNLSIYGSDSGRSLLSWWLGENYIPEQESALVARSGRGVFFRIVALNLILAIAAFIVLWHFGYHILAPIGVGVYLAVVAVRGIMAMWHSHIHLTDTYVIINGGQFADIHNFVKYADIESVMIRHTPFSRFTHRVALTVATNGTAFTVRSLRVAEAQEIYNLLLHQQTQ